MLHPKLKNEYDTLCKQKKAATNRDKYDREKRKYLLNINTAIIHDGNAPCYQGRMMAESNQKWFYKYAEAVNYFEGKSKKGVPCNRCLRDLIDEQ